MGNESHYPYLKVMGPSSSNQISIELFPAGNGDAILIDLGQELLLIDGGYTSTFRDHIKPRLLEYHRAGRRLTKFIVTHIDADHISGAIAFIKENGPADNPSIIKIDEVWFNSYRHLVFEEKEQGDFEGKIPEIPISGGLVSAETEDENQLVSYKQGTTLGSQLLKHHYAWNTTFDGSAVKADEPLTISLSDDLRLTLLGPTQEALDTMADKWYDYLRERFGGKINEDAYFDDAFELLMEEMRQTDLEVRAARDEEALVSEGVDWVEANAVAWESEDDSPTNGSSITFLLEYNGKKLLFLGDAIPGQVVQQIKKLASAAELPLPLDVLKVSHHGAWSNNSPELIRLLQADHYLFSSNGLRHHHPHLETLAWIVKSHGADTFKTMVFNYRQGERLLAIDNSASKQKYNYGVLWPDVDQWGNGTDGYVKLTLD
ncbi:MBL fold metallo-hydrolase [Flavobacteriaceae bacterium TP-CH-4]|uniref:MBL fold metallo-hydrolase n=1 Tax=Pelagihabitans pacificus TaxID=2696054 RepID=A0A967E944_9FLAO|nr:MBL fold metallo-hydrolase [Pelagihabitans pacificus]NHF58111.1 MBL fold metallo-hydrolase [Pelagihabitans pacificus]